MKNIADNNADIILKFLLVYRWEKKKTTKLTKDGSDTHD